MGRKTGKVERQSVTYHFVIREKNGVCRDAGYAAVLRRILRHDDTDLAALFHQVNRDIPGIRPAAGAGEREVIYNQYPQA